jgi:hypothetical protein
MTKGHMKHPHHGIRSTRCAATNEPTAPNTVPVILPVPDVLFNQQLDPINVISAIGPAPNIINNNDESFANLFCLGHLQAGYWA